MRWKCVLSPEKGDKRKKTKFLLFPICIDCEWRWLETVTIQQQFDGWGYNNYECYESELWKNIKFID